MTRNNMADIKFPSGLSTKGSADNADILLIADSQDSNRSKGITKANLLSGVTTDLSNKVDLTSAQDVTGQKTFINLINKEVMYLKDSTGTLQRHITHGDDFIISESGVADNRIRIKAGGNIGIGVDPDSKLQVGADGSANLRIGYNGTNDNYVDSVITTFRNVGGGDGTTFNIKGNANIGENVLSSYRLKVIGYHDTEPLQTRGDGGVVYVGIGRNTGNACWMKAGNYGGHDMGFRGNYNFENNISIGGNRVDGERTSYTPTVGATSGSASSVTVNMARYKQVGKMVFVTGRMSFAKNTLSGSVYITLPVADNSYLGSITGFIGDNAGLSINQGRTQLENASRMYFENGFGTSYVAASDLGGGTVWVRRNGVYEAA